MSEENKTPEAPDSKSGASSDFGGWWDDWLKDGMTCRDMSKASPEEIEAWRDKSIEAMRIRGLL